MDIAQAGEIARSASPLGSVPRRELTTARVGLLYELAYLRMFASWEAFLEDSFLRMMCGWISALHLPLLRSPHTPFATIGEARAALLNGRDFILWHNPNAVERRCVKWFSDGVHSEVLASDEARLEWYAAVRHRIAHGSAQVKKEMDIASMGLAGQRYPGASAGSFLRDWRSSEPLIQERWLRTIAVELMELARQIAP
ncbi:MAG TPA: hypothetical protein VMR96_01910 [Solirubrobacterales bacterium]|nr:hypothetical protein [Solirubrobacterales bacterium]